MSSDAELQVVRHPREFKFLIVFALRAGRFNFGWCDGTGPTCRQLGAVDLLKQLARGCHKPDCLLVNGALAVAAVTLGVRTSISSVPI